MTIAVDMDVNKHQFKQTIHFTGRRFIKYAEMALPWIMCKEMQMHKISQRINVL